MMSEVCQHAIYVDEFANNPELQNTDCNVCAINGINEWKARYACEMAGKEFSNLFYRLISIEMVVHNILVKSGLEPIPRQFQQMRSYAQRQECKRLDKLQREGIIVIADINIVEQDDIVLYVMCDICEHANDIAELKNNPELQYIDCTICAINKMKEDKARECCERDGKEFSPISYRLLYIENAVYRILLNSGNQPIPPQFHLMRENAVLEEQDRLANLQQAAGTLPEDDILITGVPSIPDDNIVGEVQGTPNTVLTGTTGSATATATATAADVRRPPIDPYENPENIIDITFQPWETRY